MLGHWQGVTDLCTTRTLYAVIVSCLSIANCISGRATQGTRTRQEVPELGWRLDLIEKQTSFYRIKTLDSSNKRLMPVNCGPIRSC